MSLPCLPHSLNFICCSQVIFSFSHQISRLFPFGITFPFFQVFLFTLVCSKFLSLSLLEFSSLSPPPLPHPTFSGFLSVTYLKGGRSKSPIIVDAPFTILKEFPMRIRYLAEKKKQGNIHEFECLHCSWTSKYEQQAVCGLVGISFWT